MTDAPALYRRFSRPDWARLRADAEMTLAPGEPERLRSVNDRLDLAEVEMIYLPLTRLLGLHEAAIRALFASRAAFLGHDHDATPYVIAVAGSVAVGKSTTARVLQALLSRDRPRKVALVTTDGFLRPNAELEARGLMERKGFPESYDRVAMLEFLRAVKSGRRAEAPVYSHLSYDIVPDQREVVDRPDILIFEGLNVLQTGSGEMASDHFDFSIYVDAGEALLERWYLSRFMRLRETAFHDPDSHFRAVAALCEDEAREMALSFWRDINLPNLRDNILPTRERAELILTKGEDHAVREVALRKL